MNLIDLTILIKHNSTVFVKHNLTILVKHNLVVFVKHNLTIFVKRDLTIIVKHVLTIFDGSQNREVRPRFARVPFFSYRTVLDTKRTAKMSGLRFFRSDRTIQSGFQNLDFRQQYFYYFMC